MQLTPWLIQRPGAPRRLRLFCFPYSGGAAASFLQWQADLSDDIEICGVQLPGRGQRMAEPLLRDFGVLIESLGEVVRLHGERPFAFFGHSLGALVAFELARHCRRLGLPQPQHLFVSGSSAPASRTTPRHLHHLSDEALIETLRDYNGTPTEALTNRELMEILLPVIRADFELLHGYRYQAAPPLGIPITVLAGRNDKHVSRDSIARWQDCSSLPCRQHWFDGDHFFLHTDRKAVIACLNAGLATTEGAAKREKTSTEFPT